MTLEELKQIAGGNADAERFCAAWFHMCHLVDDLVDQDKYVDPETRGRVLIEFTLEIAGNPFFQTYKAPLMAAITLAINAWVDSDKMDARMHMRDNDAPPPTKAEACTRDVLKGWWHEVFYLVAYLTGGYEAMQRASAGGRRYDFHADALPTKEGGPHVL